MFIFTTHVTEMKSLKFHFKPIIIVYTQRTFRGNSKKFLSLYFYQVAIYRKAIYVGGFEPILPT